MMYVVSEDCYNLRTVLVQTLRHEMQSYAAFYGSSLFAKVLVYQVSRMKRVKYSGS